MKYCLTCPKCNNQDLELSQGYYTCKKCGYEEVPHEYKVTRLNLDGGA